MSANDEFTKTALGMLDQLHGKTLTFYPTCAVCSGSITEPCEICETCNWQEDALLDDDWSYANGEFLAEARANWAARIIN